MGALWLTAALERAPGRGRIGSVITHAVLILGAVTMLAPFLWELLTSLKTLGEALAVPPKVLPAVPQWNNYFEVFDSLPFAAQFGVTAAQTIIRTAGQVFLRPPRASRSPGSSSPSSARSSRSSSRP